MYVEPRKRYLGSKKGEDPEDFWAYDSPLAETLEAIFATRPDIWNDVESFKGRVEARLRNSEEFDESTRISDIIDGVEFGRFYRRMNLQVGERPLVFMLYYDGLEVVNGMGQARVTHELACFYWALIPISDWEKRLLPENLRLATVCLKRAIPCVGIGTVINGRAEDGEENTAWGAQMEKLGRAEGMMLKIPPGPDSNGQEPSKAKFRGGTALVPADTPAGSELFGYKKSVGHATKSICKGCHCLQHGDPPPYRQPNSFVSSLHGWKRSCAGRKKQFQLRSAQDFKDYLQKLQALERNEISETDLEAWKQEVGVNYFLTAMWQCRFLSLTTGCPMDMMHVLAEGTARVLLGCISWVMIRKWGVHEDKVVAAIKRYAAAHGHKRNRYPYINYSRVAKLKEWTEDGVCKPDCDFPGTAMQVGATAQYSYVIGVECPVVAIW